MFKIKIRVVGVEILLIVSTVFTIKHVLALSNDGKKTKAEAALFTDFQNIRDDWKIKKKDIPENKFMWMAFNRSTIIILKKWIKNNKILNNSKCKLGKFFFIHVTC